MKWYMRWVETGRVPDAVLRAGIRWLIARGMRQRYRATLEARDAAKRALIDKFRHSPIAVHTDDANAQHYEVPSRFFQLALGPWLKYSCCYWPPGVTTLEQAEAAMLRLTCQRAGLADGMTVLDLGCGWGSLALWIGQHYPNCQVVAVSNSRTQREYIERQCQARGIGNVQARTADVKDFDAGRVFDRVLSVEMFEHMKNYERLMAKIASWLKPEGKLFVYIFCHREFAYEFDADDPDDWMAQTFFSGGTMPSDDLLLYFQRDLQLVDHWRVNGRHYARTLRAWLAKLDRQRDEVCQIMAKVYGPQGDVLRQAQDGMVSLSNRQDATRRLVNWRLFFMGCEETFRLGRGYEYIVSHYLFQKNAQAI